MALQKAPDDVVVAYLEVRLAVARAFAPADAKACVATLMNQPDRTGAYLAGALPALPPAVRRSYEESQVRVLHASTAPGTRTPAYTAAEAHAHSNEVPKPRNVEKAVNPNASLDDQCRADVDLYGAMLGMKDPGRIRTLRYMNNI